MLAPSSSWNEDTNNHMRHPEWNKDMGTAVGGTWDEVVAGDTYQGGIWLADPRTGSARDEIRIEDEDVAERVIELLNEGEAAKAALAALQGPLPHLSWEEREPRYYREPGAPRRRALACRLQTPLGDGEAEAWELPDGGAEANYLGMSWALRRRFPDLDQARQWLEDHWPLAQALRRIHALEQALAATRAESR